MLKEVGTSGQIPVGKKYADQLFNLVFCPDGGLEMMSIKVVPFVNEATSFQYPAQAQYPAQWVQDTALFYLERTPEQFNLARDKREKEDNKRSTIADYRKIKRVGSMGWRLHRWRKKQVQPTHAAV